MRERIGVRNPKKELNIKKHIPNTITLGNLLCGCLAIIKTFEGDLVLAAYFVGIALVLDFFDGFTARLLKVASPIGKDLDSLADMVTFGVVPGLLVFQLFKLAIPIQNFHGCAGCETPGYYSASSGLESYLPYLGLLIPIFSCIRLAKFNNDTRQSDSFIGLPTPANAMVVCSLPLIIQYGEGLDGSSYPTTEAGLIYQYWFLIALSVVMSLLLVTEIPLFALKFKGFSWADGQNRLRFIFLGLAVILLLTLHFVAIPLVILLYILLSIVNNIFLKKKV
jgi:CDP-diacylglycerol--serine O-phosphatidyltransferase